MANDGSITLLSEATANGAGEARVWPGGVGQFTAWGDFDGGTAKLQFSPDEGVNWIDAGTDTELTEDGGGIFTLAPCLIRADLSGATAPEVNATASRAE